MFVTRTASSGRRSRRTLPISKVLRVRRTPFFRSPNMSANSFDAKATLTVGDRSFEIFRLDALQSKYDVARLPFSLKILLEHLLRNEDGESIRAGDIEALASWNASA